MKRNLIISERKEALHAMLAMLSANMMDNELEEVSSTSENREDLYGVKLVWLDRGANGWVGCPCFVSKFDGCLPNGRKIKAVVYVKIFASRTFQMCKMVFDPSAETLQVLQNVRRLLGVDFADLQNGF